jgi:hypothetical protein
MAVLANVDHLVVRARKLTRAAEQIQSKFLCSAILST